VALIVVVALHLGLIWVFTVSRKALREVAGEAPSMTVVFLPQTPAAGEPTAQPSPGAGPSLRPKNKPPTRAALSTSPAPLDSTAIAPQLSELEETPAPASIDWYKEAELSASRQAESLENTRKRAAGFTALEANRETRKAPASKSEFGWSHAQTHRIEPLPEGGTLVWINDRCFIVLNGGVLPLCSLGKIEVRGDLFEHMRDAPESDDWKQP
jgi:hypothetical protein